VAAERDRQRPSLDPRGGPAFRQRSNTGRGGTPPAGLCYRGYRRGRVFAWSSANHAAYRRAARTWSGVKSYSAQSSDSPVPAASWPMMTAAGRRVPAMTGLPNATSESAVMPGTISPRLDLRIAPRVSHRNAIVLALEVTCPPHCPGYAFRPPQDPSAFPIPQARSTVRIARAVRRFCRRFPRTRAFSQARGVVHRQGTQHGTRGFSAIRIAPPGPRVSSCRGAWPAWAASPCRLAIAPRRPPAAVPLGRARR
jgi:hypothetical protein